MLKGLSTQRELHYSPRAAACKLTEGLMRQRVLMQGLPQLDDMQAHTRSNEEAYVDEPPTTIMTCLHGSPSSSD